MDIITIAAVLSVLEPVLNLIIISLVYLFKTKNFWAAIHINDTPTWPYIAILTVAVCVLATIGRIPEMLIVFIPTALIATTKTYYEMGLRQTN